MVDELCRSSTLTGKFVHNHHTYENSVEKGCSAPSWRSEHESKTVGAYMTAAGYKTGFFGKIKCANVTDLSYNIIHWCMLGKYLNNYALENSGVGVGHIPPGWTTWYTLQGNRYYRC